MQSPTEQLNAKIKAKHAELCAKIDVIQGRMYDLQAGWTRFIAT